MASDPKPVVTGYPAAQPSYAAAAPGAAAYPYPAPPPPYYPQPAYYAAPAPRRPNTLLLRRLLFLLFAIFLLVGAATLLVWLVLRPRLPVLTVSSLRVSSFNLSSSLLSSDFDLSLSVENPNHKMSVSYDHVVASVFFDYDVLAETSLPPFYQAKRNSTLLHARMEAVGEYVDPDVADGISRQRSGGGAVGLDVRVSAVVRFRAGAWRTRSNTMRVFCGDVSVAFSNATASTGALAGPPKGCRVDL